MGLGRARSRRVTGRLAAVLVLVTCLLATSCSTDAAPPPSATPTASDEILSTPMVPPIPELVEPTAGPSAVPADPAADVGLATEPPVSGSTVLVHLEGPADNNEATDVVIRNEVGAEITRYRLAGARTILASSGATTALIRVVPNGWARYDAVTDTLARITFPEEPPGPTIAVGSGVSGPAALWDPAEPRFLTRLDTGDLTDLASEGGVLTAAMLSRNGGIAILRGEEDRIAVVRTLTGERRDMVEASVIPGESGQLLGVVSPTGAARVESVDGGLQLDLGEVGEGAEVLPLGPRLALVTGPTPSIRGRISAEDQPTEPVSVVPRPDSASTISQTAPLTPVVALGWPLRASQDGSQVLATTADGLAVVDVAAATITVLPDTAGYQPVMSGSGAVLWAWSSDPEAPGVLAVDPESATVTRMLSDVATVQPLSSSADGTTMTFATRTADGVLQAAVLRAASAAPVDLTSALTVPDAQFRAFVHPGGRILSIEQTGVDAQRLVLLPPEGQPAFIADARQPVWLATTT